MEEEFHPAFVQEKTSRGSKRRREMAAQTEAEREEMLDRMLTRLALADDSNLQQLLVKILPYSISSLSSTSESVRKSVMEILRHLNKRVKHCPEILLPFSELWDIYRETGAPPMVRNFCIVYIEMAFERLPVEEKASRAPELLAATAGISSQHQDIILRIVMKVISDCHSSKVAADIGRNYKALGSGQEGQLFVEFCLNTILYQPPPTGVGCPAGLSISQSDRITGKIVLKGDMLIKRKLGILNVIEVMQLPSKLSYPLYLAASCDSQELVTIRGEELLKRNAADSNFEDSDLISRLFLLFNGTTVVERVPVESRVAPASAALRVRLMSVFTHSIIAANSFPLTLQCVFNCIYGNGTTSRLKQLGMEFTIWVFKHAVMDQLKLMGPLILSAIVKSLDVSLAVESDAAGRSIKSFAFQALGLLASRMPNLFRDKVDMAVRIFTALKLADQSIRLTIQESLIALAVAYKGSSASVLKDLEQLLLENSHAEQSEVRLCALRWCTSLFDSQHCPSRYVCMLLAADSKLDIREIALEGLYLKKDQEQITDVTGFRYPELRKMLDFIFEQQPKLIESSEQRGEKLIFESKTYVAMIKFLMKCFTGDLRISNPEVTMTESIGMMFLLLEHAMAFEGSTELHATAAKALVEIGFSLPKLVSSHYGKRVPWLKHFLSHIDQDTRESAARLLGLVCSVVSASSVSSLISELDSLINGSQIMRYEIQHGALCAIGYVIAEYSKEAPSKSGELFESSFNHIIKVIELESTQLAAVAMEALGHIGLRCSLPRLNHNSVMVGVLSSLRERLDKLLASDDIKSTQKIVISLGHMSVNEPSIAELNVALGLIFNLSRSKVEDVLFAAGEALSFIWGGVPVTVDTILKSNYRSLSQSSNYLAGEMALSDLNDSSSASDTHRGEAHVIREVIVRKLFDVLLYSGRKDERCAGAVWLVSLITYCGNHPKIQQLLPEIQEAFSHLLGDQNDLTQELASQGMSIVYELGDLSMKQDLVTALVSTLTGSGKRKRAIKLMEDSEIFQEGIIGESPSGGKLSTYKELCSLANEMGQPDLIYKFMDLANYQAALNSKRGAAFGFSKIAKQAGNALKPHLFLLIPRLVRYQYDPDKNVQDAMGHIWKAIVTEPKKTIAEYFDIIIDDLLAQSSSRLWRSREASCLALADIIQGRKFCQVAKHLKGIWSAAFRAMDDIKETVRNSGDSLCRAVSSLTIRLCDVSLTAESEAKGAMDLILPFLLTEGIVSRVSSVQKASISLVMKLAKGAGTAVQPHLAELVCCMLECLSSLEDQRLNYIELHAESVGIQAEKLENLRITVAKDSPMWETLDICLRLVDASSLGQLVPRLAQLVRSAVGLNTRVGTASFINLLVQKVNASIKPYTSMLLKLLFSVVLEEKGHSVKRAFAAACAIVLKFAEPSQAQKLIEDTVTLHLGEGNAKISCGFLLKNYFSLAADVINGYHAIVFPVIFISRFEEDKDISVLFESLWEENITSERLVLKLYLQEIISLLCDFLSSSEWASKRKSAKAAKNLCDTLGGSLSSFHQSLLKSLLKELPGRHWEGKDTILYAIASLCSSCPDAISAEDPNVPTVILQALSSACTKKVRSYREAAFSCLQQVLKGLGSSESFHIVFPLLYEVCSQICGPLPGNTMVVNTSSGSGDESVEDVSSPLDKVLDCVTSCIHIAQLQDLVEQGNQLIHIILCCFSAGVNWTAKISAFASIKELSLKLRLFENDTSTFFEKATCLINELYQSLVPRIIDCLHSIKIAQVHFAASECLVAVVELCKLVPTIIKDMKLKDDLIHLSEVEKNEQAKALLRKCVSILDSNQMHP